MARYLLINGKRYQIEFDTSSGGSYTIGPEASTPDDAILASYPELVQVSKSLYASDDTNISIDEIYNQFEINCDVKEVEDLITSPLRSEDLFSPFTNAQKYCSELSAKGEGERAMKGFIDLLTKFNTSYDGGTKTDWYVQLYKSKNWKFSGDKYIDETENKNQYKVLQRARANSCTTFIAAFGHTNPVNEKDNSVQGRPDMQKYLVLAINGNRIDNSTYTYPTSSIIQQSSPCAEYIGNLAGGFLSPVDSDTTNYIVFSGKFVIVSSLQRSITMNDTATINSSIIDSYYDEAEGEEVYVYAQDPQAGKVCDYPTLREYAEQGYGAFKDKFWHSTVHLDDDANSDGFYYTCAFYDNEYPTSNDTLRLEKNKESLYPYNKEHKSLTELPYNYSEKWDSTDKLFKLPILACQLKVGDKTCCEFNDEWGNPVYQWLTEDQIPETTVDGVSYKLDKIYLGCNPKIGDDFIGTEWEITNTVTPQINIDTTGLAIPIKQSDMLNGRVEFKILGPVNVVYDQVCRHHPSFWQHTRFWTESKAMLAHANMILISDFECKIYTDNANINNYDEDADLVYQSDEPQSDFINKHDESFNIVSALTTKECKEKGIRNSIKMNNPWLENTPLREVVNVISGDVGKPEEHYLTNYYREYSKPRIILESTMFEDREYNWLTHYQFPEFGSREFMVQSITHHLKNATVTLTLKEINSIDSSVPVPPEPEPIVISTPQIAVSSNTVSITCDTEDAIIYYTLNGNEPNPLSSVYTEPFKITQTCTVKAVAVLNDTASDTATQTCTYYAPPDNPVITITQNTFYKSANISSQTFGAQIFYKYYASANPATIDYDINNYTKGKSRDPIANNYYIIAIAKANNIYSDYVWVSSDGNSGTIPYDSVN